MNTVFSINKQVYYKPRLSGLNNNKALLINHISFETADIFGNAREKTLPVYHFKGTDLCAYDEQLSIHPPVKKSNPHQ